MVQVLWRRTNNVDKQEMDALFDVAIISGEGETSASPAKRVSRSSRKRPREQDNDKTEGQGMGALPIVIKPFV